MLKFLVQYQPCHLAILATTVLIETERNWWYNSCEICSCGVDGKDDGSFWCGKCKTSVKHIVPRYY